MRLIVYRTLHIETSIVFSACVGGFVAFDGVALQEPWREESGRANTWFILLKARAALFAFGCRDVFVELVVADLYARTSSSLQ